MTDAPSKHLLTIPDIVEPPSTSLTRFNKLIPRVNPLNIQDKRFLTVPKSQSSKKSRKAEEGKTHASVASKVTSPRYSASATLLPASRIQPKPPATTKLASACKTTNYPTQTGSKMERVEFGSLPNGQGAGEGPGRRVRVRSGGLARSLEASLVPLSACCTPKGKSEGQGTCLS